MSEQVSAGNAFSNTDSLSEETHADALVTNTDNNNNECNSKTADYADDVTDENSNTTGNEQPTVGHASAYDGSSLVAVRSSHSRGSMRVTARPPIQPRPLVADVGLADDFGAEDDELFFFAAAPTLNETAPDLTPGELLEQAARGGTAALLEVNHENPDNRSAQNNTPPMFEEMLPTNTGTVYESSSGIPVDARDQAVETSHRRGSPNEGRRMLHSPERPNAAQNLSPQLTRIPVDLVDVSGYDLEGDRGERDDDIDSLNLSSSDPIFRVHGPTRIPQIEPVAHNQATGISETHNNNISSVTNNNDVIYCSWSENRENSTGASHGIDSTNQERVANIIISPQIRENSQRLNFVNFNIESLDDSGPLSESTLPETSGNQQNEHSPESPPEKELTEDESQRLASAKNDFQSIEVRKNSPGPIINQRERTEQDADDLLNKIISGKTEQGMGPKYALSSDNDSSSSLGRPAASSCSDHTQSKSGTGYLRRVGGDCRRNMFSCHSNTVLERSMSDCTQVENCDGTSRGIPDINTSSDSHATSHAALTESLDECSESDSHRRSADIADDGTTHSDKSYPSANENCIAGDEEIIESCITDKNVTANINANLLNSPSGSVTNVLYTLKEESSIYDHGAKPCINYVSVSSGENEKLGFVCTETTVSESKVNKDVCMIHDNIGHAIEICVSHLPVKYDLPTNKELSNFETIGRDTEGQTKVSSSAYFERETASIPDDAALSVENVETVQEGSEEDFMNDNNRLPSKITPSLPILEADDDFEAIQYKTENGEKYRKEDANCKFVDKGGKSAAMINTSSIAGLSTLGMNGNSSSAIEDNSNAETKYSRREELFSNIITCVPADNSKSESATVGFFHEIEGEESNLETLNPSPQLHEHVFKAEPTNTFTLESENENELKTSNSTFAVDHKLCASNSRESYSACQGTCDDLLAKEKLVLRTAREVANSKEENHLKDTNYVSMSNIGSGGEIASALSYSRNNLSGCHLNDIHSNVNDATECHLNDIQNNVNDTIECHLNDTHSNVNNAMECHLNDTHSNVNDATECHLNDIHSNVNDSTECHLNDIHGNVNDATECHLNDIHSNVNDSTECHLNDIHSNVNDSTECHVNDTHSNVNDAADCHLNDTNSNVNDSTKCHLNDIQNNVNDTIECHLNDTHSNVNNATECHLNDIHSNVNDSTESHLNDIHSNVNDSTECHVNDTHSNVKYAKEGQHNDTHSNVNDAMECNLNDIHNNVKYATECHLNDTHSNVNDSTECHLNDTHSNVNDAMERHLNDTQSNVNDATNCHLNDSHSNVNDAMGFNLNDIHNNVKYAEECHLNDINSNVNDAIECHLNDIHSNVNDAMECHLNDTHSNVNDSTDCHLNDIQNNVNDTTECHLNDTHSNVNDAMEYHLNDTHSNVNDATNCHMNDIHSNVKYATECHLNDTHSDVNDTTESHLNDTHSNVDDAMECHLNDTHINACTASFDQEKLMEPLGVEVSQTKPVDEESAVSDDPCLLSVSSPTTHHKVAISDLVLPKLPLGEVTESESSTFDGDQTIKTSERISPPRSVRDEKKQGLCLNATKYKHTDVRQNPHIYDTLDTVSDEAKDNSSVSSNHTNETKSKIELRGGNANTLSEDFFVGYSDEPVKQLNEDGDDKSNENKLVGESNNEAVNHMILSVSDDTHEVSENQRILMDTASVLNEDIEDEHGDMTGFRREENGSKEHKNKIEARSIESCRKIVNCCSQEPVQVDNIDLDAISTNELCDEEKKEIDVASQEICDTAELGSTPSMTRLTTRDSQNLHEIVSKNCAYEEEGVIPTCVEGGGRSNMTEDNNESCYALRGVAFRAITPSNENSSIEAKGSNGVGSCSDDGNCEESVTPDGRDKLETTCEDYSSMDSFHMTETQVDLSTQHKEHPCEDGPCHHGGLTPVDTSADFPDFGKPCYTDVHGKEEPKDLTLSDGSKITGMTSTDQVKVIRTKSSENNKEDENTKDEDYFDKQIAFKWDDTKVTFPRLGGEKCQSQNSEGIVSVPSKTTHLPRIACVKTIDLCPTGHEASLAGEDSVAQDSQNHAVGDIQSNYKSEHSFEQNGFGRDARFDTASKDQPTEKIETLYDECVKQTRSPESCGILSKDEYNVIPTDQTTERLSPHDVVSPVDSKIKESNVANQSVGKIHDGKSVQVAENIISEEFCDFFETHEKDRSNLSEHSNHYESFEALITQSVELCEGIRASKETSNENILDERNSPNATDESDLSVENNELTCRHTNVLDTSSKECMTKTSALSLDNIVLQGDSKGVNEDISKVYNQSVQLADSNNEDTKRIMTTVIDSVSTTPQEKSPSEKVILEATDMWLQKISEFCKSPTLLTNNGGDEKIHEFTAKCKSQIQSISTVKQEPPEGAHISENPSGYTKDSSDKRDVVLADHRSSRIHGPHSLLPYAVCPPPQPKTNSDSVAGPKTRFKKPSTRMPVTCGSQSPTDMPQTHLRNPTPPAGTGPTRRDRGSLAPVVLKKSVEQIAQGSGDVCTPGCANSSNAKGEVDDGDNLPSDKVLNTQTKGLARVAGGCSKYRHERGVKSDSKRGAAGDVSEEDHVSEKSSPIVDGAEHGGKYTSGVNLETNKPLKGIYSSPNQPPRHSGRMRSTMANELAAEPKLSTFVDGPEAPVMRRERMTAPTLSKRRPQKVMTMKEFERKQTIRHINQDFRRFSKACSSVDCHMDPYLLGLSKASVEKQRAKNNYKSLIALENCRFLHVLKYTKSVYHGNAQAGLQNRSTKFTRPSDRHQNQPHLDKLAAKTLPKIAWSATANSHQQAKVKVHPPHSSRLVRKV